MDKPRSEPKILIVDKGYDSDPSVKTSPQEARNRRQISWKRVFSEVLSHLNRQLPA